jgi:hypothetical protein
MQFSPFSSHLIPLRSKYPPQHPVLKHPQYNIFVINKVKLLQIILSVSVGYYNEALKM